MEKECWIIYLSSFAFVFVGSQKVKFPTRKLISAVIFDCFIETLPMVHVGVLIADVDLSAHLKRVLRFIVHHASCDSRRSWSWLGLDCNAAVHYVTAPSSLSQWDLVLWSTQRWRRPTTSGPTRPLTSWCRGIASTAATADRTLPLRGRHCV